jgi:hypothetical protein
VVSKEAKESDSPNHIKRDMIFGRNHRVGVPGYRGGSL